MTSTLPTDRPPIFVCPLNHAVIHLGIASIEAEFKRKDEPNDTHSSYLPRWHTYPDNETHWQLINERREATMADYERIFDWIIEEKERCKRLNDRT